MEIGEKSELEKKEIFHPGKILKEAYIEPRRYTVTEVARALRISRNSLSVLLNGHVSVTPEMAVRLAKVFNTSPHQWLVFQMDFDLQNAQRKLANIEFERLK